MGKRNVSCRASFSDAKAGDGGVDDRDDAGDDACDELVDLLELLLWYGDHVSSHRTTG